MPRLSIIISHLWFVSLHQTVTKNQKTNSFVLIFVVAIIEEGILEAKTECYEKDKVKSPPFFQSFYDDF